MPAVSLAAATTPRFPSNTIVPNKSVGGLSLGASPSAARQVFGTKACPSSGCIYSGPDGLTANVLFGSVKAHTAPTILEITVSAPEGPRAPLDELQTARGVGLGSTAAAVKKAYPHATGSPSRGGYFIAGPGEHSTTFGIEKNRVTSISMVSVHLG